MFWRTEGIEFLASPTSLLIGGKKFLRILRNCFQIYIYKNKQTKIDVLWYHMKIYVTKESTFCVAFRIKSNVKQLCYLL